MTIKEFFSFKTNKYFWVNILVMIVAVGLICSLIVSRYRRDEMAGCLYSSR